VQRRSGIVLTYIPLRRGALGFYGSTESSLGTCLVCCAREPRRECSSIPRLGKSEMIHYNVIFVFRTSFSCTARWFIRLFVQTAAVLPDHSWIVLNLASSPLLSTYGHIQAWRCSDHVRPWLSAIFPFECLPEYRTFYFSWFHTHCRSDPVWAQWDWRRASWLWEPELLCQSTSLLSEDRRVASRVELYRHTTWFEANICGLRWGSGKSWEERARCCM